METLMIILFVLVIILFYIQFKPKYTKTTKNIAVLRNKLTPEWSNGTDKPFDTIPNSGIYGERVLLIRTEYFKNNKLYKETYSVDIDIANDYDDCI